MPRATNSLMGGIEFRAYYLWDPEAGSTCSIPDDPDLPFSHLLEELGILLDN